MKGDYMKNKIFIILTILMVSIMVSTSYAQPGSMAPLLKSSVADNITETANDTIKNISQIANDTEKQVQDNLSPIQTILDTINSIIYTITDIFQNIQMITGQ
jgi:peptidoglycan hydrolase CwlO-like protein